MFVCLFSRFGWVSLLSLVGSSILGSSGNGNNSQVISVTLGGVRNSQSKLSWSLVLVEFLNVNRLGWLVAVLGNFGSNNNLTVLLSNTNSFVVNQTRRVLGVLLGQVQWVSGENKTIVFDSETGLFFGQFPNQVAVKLLVKRKGLLILKYKGINDGHESII